MFRLGLGLRPGPQRCVGDDVNLDSMFYSASPCASTSASWDTVLSVTAMNAMFRHCLDGAFGDERHPHGSPSLGGGPRRRRGDVPGHLDVGHSG